MAFIMMNTASAARAFPARSFYKNAGAFYDVISVKTAIVRSNFVNNVDATDDTVDRLRTFDDYSGSPTQFTATCWDDVTGLGSPNGLF